MTIYQNRLLCCAVRGHPWKPLLLHFAQPLFLLRLCGYMRKLESCVGLRIEGSNDIVTGCNSIFREERELLCRFRCSARDHELGSILF